MFKVSLRPILHYKNSYSYIYIIFYNYNYLKVMRLLCLMWMLKINYTLTYKGSTYKILPDTCSLYQLVL